MFPQAEFNSLGAQAADSKLNMFGLFKKLPAPERGPLEALIISMGAYAGQKVCSHLKLLALCPERETAAIEMFLYNLWVCFSAATEITERNFAHRAVQERQRFASDILIALAIDCGRNALPYLKREYGVRPVRFTSDLFEAYIKTSLREYEEHVASHQDPPWVSAGFYLGARCRVPIDVRLMDRDGANALGKEAYDIYRTMHPTVLREAEKVFCR